MNLVTEWNSMEHTSFGCLPFFVKIINVEVRKAQTPAFGYHVLGEVCFVGKLCGIAEFKFPHV